MPMNTHFEPVEPTREQVDALAEPLVLEFGTPWCGYCSSAQPLIAEAFGAHAGVRHLKIEDGPGRRLGRSFRVKLWPTLVFMRDGVEVSRLVRPQHADEIRRALDQIAAHTG